ncbi:hypothetical protein LguiB_024233 [Lonicera macranthoides]
MKGQLDCHTMTGNRLNGKEDPKNGESSINPRFIQRVRKFHLEHKSFSLRFDNGGASVIIVEENWKQKYTVSIDFGVVDWVVKSLKKANCQYDEESFFDKFQGSYALFLLQHFRNKNGRFISLSRIINGTVKGFVAFPAGKKGEGWLVVAQELSWFIYDPTKLRKEDQWMNIEGRLNKYTEIKGRGGRDHRSFAECVASHSKEKTNRKVLSNSIGWNFRLGKEGISDWNRMIPDKAMFYCEDRNDAEFFEWNKIIALRDGLTVCTQSWNRAPVAMNKKLSFTGGWLCIEDLPLKWWTREVFELIGKRCGGLLEYDKRTAIMSQIFSAKIRARGNSSGFIPAEIDVCIEEDNFTVKLKVISKLNLSKRYRQTVNSARHDCKRHRIVVAGSEEGEKAVELNDQEISNDEDPSVQRSVEKGEANAMNKVLTSRSKIINHNSNAMLVNVDNIFSALRKDLGDNGPAGLNHLKSPVKLMEGQTKEYCLKPKRFKSGEIRSNINNNLLVYRRKENKEVVILNNKEEAHVTRFEGEEEGDTDDNGEDELEDYAKIEGNEQIEVGEEGDEMQEDEATEEYSTEAETEHGIEEEGLEGVNIFGKPTLLNTVHDTQILAIEPSKFTITSPISPSRSLNQSEGNILLTFPSPYNLNLQAFNSHTLCTTEKSCEGVIESHVPYTPINENQDLSSLNACQVKLNNQ